MLQQTTVAAVSGRYERFLARFPDVRSLSRAREESVLAEWSGLGYYARARHLHRAARRIISDHGGRFPEDPEKLAALPGFGAYMAAAVACLAFGQRVPAAEANVSRVLSRIFAIEGSRSKREREVLDRAGELLPRSRPGDGLAALMDLGQLVCTPRRPRCRECPLAGECRALALDAVERYPTRRAFGPMRTVHVAAAIAVRDGRALLVRKSGGPLAGLWTFPSAESATPEGARRALQRLLRDLTMRLSAGPPAARATHTILRKRLRIAVFAASAGAGRPRGDELRWLPLPAIERSATPTLTRKIARVAGSLRERRRKLESMLGILLLAAAAVSPAAPSGPARLTLKNGTVYQLREPPRISGGRIVFQTVDGKIFSIAESEVSTIGSGAPPPTATPKYSSQDSRALGAIARQQRNRKGKAAEVAPRPPAVRKKPVAVRRRRPTPTPAG